MKVQIRTVKVAVVLFLLPVVSWSQGLSWWVEPASHKVMPDRPPQPRKQVEISAARNEYEPFQVVLRADGGNLNNVDVRMSDLVGPGGAVIPSPNVTLYLGSYVSVTFPSGNSGMGDGVPGNPRLPGEYIDPLIPLFDPYHETHYAVATPFSIPQNRLQPVFGDIYVPAEAPAGIYRGILRVLAGFAVAAEIPVRLQVWDFTLPKQRRTATSYGLWFGGILWYHGGTDENYDAEVLRIIKNYEETLHNFRIDITNPVQGPPGLPALFNFDGEGKLIPPDYSVYDSYLQSRLEGSYWKDGSGAVMYNLGIFAPGNGWWPANLSTDEEKIQAAADFARHLKEKGFWDHVYVYVHDEPYLYPGALEAVAYDVVLMSMGDPDWISRMMATNHWVPELAYVIGIWCPLTSNYDHWNSSLPQYKREDYQRLIAAGDKLWFYVCNGTKPPYLGYDIDTIYGQEPRLLHWGAWYEGATGILYWSTNYWMADDPWGTLLDLNTWPTAARNGDGFLLYPGDHNGTIGGKGSPGWLSLDGPVISHRLMMIREGMEDIDYLLLAEDAGGKNYARKLTERIYTQFGMNPLRYDPEHPPWSYDEEELYEVRRELAEWIEESGKPAPEEGWQRGGGTGGCSLAPISSPAGRLSAALAGTVVILTGLVLSSFRRSFRTSPPPAAAGRISRKTKRRRKKILSRLLAAALFVCLFTGSACAEGEEEEEKGIGEKPVIFDHAFVNATRTAGDVSGDLDPAGPVITAMDINFTGSSVVIQGQKLSFICSFTDPDMDLTAPHLLLQVLGHDEFWTFDPTQFGGIMGSSILVRVEISKYFEPGAYLIKVGMQDDASHVGGFFLHLLIVLPYVTPEIVTFVPEDGSTDVPLNSAIRGVFSSPVVGDTPTLTLTRNDQPVDYTLRLLPNMKGITLVPSEFLLPDSEYVATLTVGELLTGGVKRVVHRFFTGPLQAAPDLTGRVYSVVLHPDNIIEPAGAEIIFTAVPLPPILIKITAFDPVAGTVSSVGAIALENPLRPNPDLPNLRFPGANARLINPYFVMGPAIMNVDLYALSGGQFDVAVNVYDFSLSGRFSASGDRFEFGIITGYIDAEEVNEALSQFLPGPIPFDVCTSLPDACDNEGHLAFRAEGLSGPYEPTIGDFYDLTINLNPATLPPASGGTVAISGEYLLNGAPSGTHAINLSTTHGTLSCGGTACSVNTANGLYSATLTVPAGLPLNTQITVTVSAASPIGTLTRHKKVTVK